MVKTASQAQLALQIRRRYVVSQICLCFTVPCWTICICVYALSFFVTFADWLWFASGVLMIVYMPIVLVLGFIHQHYGAHVDAHDMSVDYHRRFQQLEEQQQSHDAAPSEETTHTIT
jgi:succinate dehydrogenase hydrophobic anchor subunit